MDLIEWRPRTRQAREVFAYFMDAKKPFDGRRIREWLNSSQIETLAVLYAFFDNRERCKKIVPPLAFGDFYKFIQEYFTLCFKVNHGDDAWISSYHTAGHDLIGWFYCIWNDKGIPRNYLQEMKDWLGNLYMEGDPELKACLVQVTLKQLFENKGILEYFSNWGKDPELKDAYASAREWWDLKERDW